MSFHAMMTFTLCVETYGAAVHVIDSLMSVSAEPVRRGVRHSHLGAALGQSSSHRLPDAAGHTSVDTVFAQQVRRSIHGLSFEQAQALWLVDLCGCTYAEAAAEASVSRDEFAARVAAGRRSVRNAVATSPIAVPVG